TIFEDSRIPLSKWLLGIHLISSSKKGMSAHQIHRMLGISYKAAWFMMHRLRYAMKWGPLAELMKGTVEMDETYVGGRARGVKTRAARQAAYDRKAPVVALVERGSGKVRAFPMPRVTVDNLGKALAEHVKPNALLVTDEAGMYQVVAED